MRGTNHPSIVRLLSFFESPEHYFLVLERKPLHLSISIPFVGLKVAV